MSALHSPCVQTILKGLPSPLKLCDCPKQHDSAQNRNSEVHGRRLTHVSQSKTKNLASQTGSNDRPAPEHQEINMYMRCLANQEPGCRQLLGRASGVRLDHEGRRWLATGCQVLARKSICSHPWHPGARQRTEVFTAKQLSHMCMHGRVPPKRARVLEWSERTLQSAIPESGASVPEIGAAPSVHGGEHLAPTDSTTALKAVTESTSKSTQQE